MAVKLIAQRGTGELMDILVGDTDTQIGVVYEVITDRFFIGLFYNSILARGYWQNPTAVAKRVYEGLKKTRVRAALKNTPYRPEQIKRAVEAQKQRARTPIADI